MIDKPLKWTSFDVVNKVRYLLKNQFGLKKIKVGHAGTLDPLATGLLIVCTGKFTKRIEEIQACNKEYVATFMLGATTPSFDRETEIDRTFSTEGITRERIEQVLQTFEGEQEQVPPLFSAKQIGGQRAYVAARKGREVELKPSHINIERIELIDCSLPQVTVNIKCSKGTYIRALARDLGERLGSGAYLHDLRRTASGDFSINSAIEITEFEKIIRNLQPNKKNVVNDTLL